jgi:ribonuclease E
MTEQTDPATAGVQTPPGVDAGETASQPPTDGAASATTTATVETPASTGTDTDTGAAQGPAPKPRTARRSRRGGRGRGGSRSGSPTGAATSGSPDGASEPGSEAAVDADVPDDATGRAGARQRTGVVADRDAATSETEDVAEDGSSARPAASGARRRRRRGGRGRGGRGRSAGASAAAEAGEGASDEEPELPEPEPRPEVATAEAIADEEGADTADVRSETRTGTAARSRRRRGGRGRGRGRSTAAAPAGGTDDGATQVVADADEAATEEQAPATKPAASRARRRTSAAAPEGDGAKQPAADAPARTRTRRSRAKKTETDGEGRESSAVGTAGPTRLRRGRATSTGARRRREPMPVVPRVTDKLMVITEHGDRDQIAILEERALVQHYVTRAGAKSMVGNVYLGRVQNVLPGMEAAFVDVGRGRNAVLYAGEVNYSPEDLEGKQPPRIEQVLKSGQSVLVQVTKDPIGGKGARLTAKISMPGRYLVLQPNWEITGISKRLEDAERKRLRALLKKIRPEGHGLIVRTAAEEATEEDLRADVDRLLAEWNAIEKKAKKAKAPAVLYEEPELTVKVVRDLFTDEEYRELATDSERVYTLVTEYLSGVAPDLLPKVRLHTGRLPAFEEYHVVEQIHKGLDRKVWLPSGGYLVIDRTEAMTVIDVNTGKSVGKTNLEETVVNTNIEAAREVARQLRLRDIGGMIIIDFIDMLLEQNKRRVVDTLKEEMARDKTRSQVFDISPLGLLEVTRKRVSGGLLESFSETCPTCEGRGVILTYEA